MKGGDEKLRLLLPGAVFTGQQTSVCNLLRLTSTKPWGPARTAAVLSQILYNTDYFLFSVPEDFILELTEHLLRL